MLAAIKKLPAAKIKQLKSVLSEEFIDQKAHKEVSDFQSFLLTGPTMSEEQLSNIKLTEKTLIHGG